MIPKFRAWDKVEKEWLSIRTIGFDDDGSVWYLQAWDDNENDIDPPYFEDDLGVKWELLQSTGLKDKNGVEIFEGDIVKNVNGELGYIAFLKQEMGYVIVYKNRDRRLGHRNGIEDFHLETIGNIYEHPHLLKE
ncbi:YopX family protein [Staphylococcus xylosus]|uniref:YopX family protein n=1 Tax=Staphylococcus xylosus TaxID=1288 RepID=UPI002DBE09F8|nr:YopX family protein [Staphylococcus xylosus]MEB8071601.1 YopX family protein [Staphylococcus xylosus]